LTRSGFVSLLGRPNTGKSTLINAMVGEKIAITSSKPQTTRRAIRGIVNRELGQLVIVDTPGVHRPRTLLGERLNELVADVLADVDLIALCLPADEPIGPGDRRLIESIAENRAKKIAVITKTDRVGKQQLAQKLIEISQLADWQELVPVSAVAGDQVELLADLMLQLMPEAPLLYPAEQATDESDEQRICELVREAALELVRDELPHSIAVTLDEVVTKGNRPEIFVSLWVERDSQKGIIIGGQGSRLKAIGIAARSEIEAMLGQPVILRIQVRIAKEWQRDSKQLGKLGM
jgi:GTP-binding protein Era